ncbi:MAG: hypothetical protein SFU86_07535 [Pirellulaceae bacterium]|nr:hypothetical protein [Pirellulaceae bacterium]
MNAIESSLLTTCLTRTDQLRANPFTGWQDWLKREHAHQIAYGPRYAPAEWFGPLVNAERQRFLRAAYALQSRGLVTLTKSDGGKLTNVKLTPTGEDLARRLAADGRTDCMSGATVPRSPASPSGTEGPESPPPRPDGDYCYPITTEGTPNA